MQQPSSREVDLPVGTCGPSQTGKRINHAIDNVGEAVLFRLAEWCDRSRESVHCTLVSVSRRYENRLPFTPHPSGHRRRLDVADRIVVRDPLGRSRNGEGKRGSTTIVQRRPPAAMMTLDHEATDQPTHSHTAALSWVERFEEILHRLRIEANSGILHIEAPAVLVASFSSHHEQFRTVPDGAHRLQGIVHQVQGITIAESGWSTSCTSDACSAPRLVSLGERGWNAARACSPLDASATNVESIQCGT